MQSKIILIIILFLSFGLFAQNNFRKANVTFNNGTMEEVFINEFLIFKQIEYKFEEKGKLNRLELATVAKIVFEHGTEYIVRDVDIDLNRRKGYTPEPLPQLEVSLVKRKMLIGVVVRGDISLFYTEYDDLKYFYVNHGDDFEYLIYNSYNQFGRQFEDKTFKRQLFKLLECDGFDKREINTVKYQHDQLRKLFVSFNKCKGITVEDVDNKLDNISFGFSVYAGARWVTTKYRSNFFIFDQYKDNHLSFFPGIEAHLKIRNQEIFTRVSYTSTVSSRFTSSFYEERQNITIDETDEMYFKSSFIHLDLGYRRFFNMSDNALFYASFAFEYSIASNGVYFIDSTLMPFNYTDNEKSLGVFSEMTVNLCIGSLFHKKYGFELRYNPPVNHSKSLISSFVPISGLALSGFYRF